MKFKYTIILMILLCFFISLANVSASDNANMDNITMINEESSNLEISDSNQLNENFQSIDDLNDRIQNSTAGATVKIDNDIYVSKHAKCSGIEIFNNITVDGQGHTIDGNESEMDFLFRIHSNDVTLKNMVFKNWNFTHSYNLIEWLCDNGRMENCTFFNNTALYGGAVDWTGINGFMINCKFINNTADMGGAIYWYGIYGTIANCEFINNSATYGGAVYITGRNSKIDSSIFKNNDAGEDGGAIYSDGIDFILSKSDLTNNSANNGGALYSLSYPTYIFDSNFTSNNASDTAGAIYCSGDSCVINQSVFKNNSANVAGAVYGDSNDELSVYLSQFIGNSASVYGGAIMAEDLSTVTNSTFLNNKAQIGGAVYSDSETDFVNSTFTSNRAETGGAIAMGDGSVINSTFTGNNVNGSGGAIAAGGDVLVNGSSFAKNVAGDGSNNIFSDNANVTADNVTSDTLLISKSMDIEVDIPDINYGSSLKVNVVLPANITEGKVYAVVGNNYESKNLTGNSTSFTFTGLNAGNHTVSIFYECSDYNTPAVNYTATVLKKDIAITAKTATFVINYAGTYSVTVKDKNGKAVSGEKVTLYISGKAIKTVTTNKNGVASFKIYASKLKSLKSGTKTLKVTLNSNYNPNVKTVKIKINKEKTKIVAKKKTFKKYLKTKKYTIQLKNSKNKVIKNVKVKLKVKGKTYTAKTNSKGKATFKITKLNKKGKFTAKITFTTTKYYKGASKSIKLTIR